MPSQHMSTHSNTSMGGTGSTGCVCTAALAQVLWHLGFVHVGSGPGGCSHAYWGPIEVLAPQPSLGKAQDAPVRFAIYLSHYFCTLLL